MRGGRAKLPVLAEISGPPDEARVWSLRRADLEAMEALLAKLSGHRVVVLTGGRRHMLLLDVVPLFESAVDLANAPAVLTAMIALPEVAERLGVSASYVSAVEAGRRNLTLGQLANIANAMRLGIDISFIRPDGQPVRADRA